jgi:hypothetical protein
MQLLFYSINKRKQKSSYLQSLSETDLEKKVEVLSRQKIKLEKTNIKK